MVASDGFSGTPLEPANPSEGWQTATDRRNKRNSEVQSNIAKLVEQALREAQGMQNRVPEVAPPALDQGEVFTRSQTTENFETQEFISENEPKKKRWRRFRTSWVPMSRFPNREERKLLNKNVNTMSDWDFDCALAEYERNDRKLQEIAGAIQENLTRLERQGERAECYVRMQEKLKRKLFTAENKRLPSHYHSAAACVYTNHATRHKLTQDRIRRHRARSVDEFIAQLKDLKARNKSFISTSKAYLTSAKEYLTWWKEYLHEAPKKVPTQNAPETPVPFQGPPYVHRSTKEKQRRTKVLKNRECAKVKGHRVARKLTTYHCVKPS